MKLFNTAADYEGFDLNPALPLTILYWCYNVCYQKLCAGGGLMKPLQHDNVIPLYHQLMDRLKVSIEKEQGAPGLKMWAKAIWKS
jgi:hypothetical protein